MKIALAQFNPTVGDFEGNSSPHPRTGAPRPNPAAPISPSFPSSASAATPRRISSSAPPSSNAIRQELVAPRAKPSRSHRSSASWAKRMDDTGKPVANSAALIANGKILFEQRKMLLPTYDVFDESRYFQPAHTPAHFPLQRRTTRHHHLRRLLERQKLLAQAPLRTRSRCRTRREGKHACS